jgi:zona occludens toxin (predicted ATPase)
MITIITGVPGMGKTALVVSMMLKELEKGERPFFVMGIPELKLDHSPVPPVIEWTEKRPDPDDPSIELDYYTFPKNSIIIIDEAQRVFRPRASSSKVPPHVAAQETHRHTGVDFWLLTQKPRLIDSNIRDLAGRHIHLKKTIMGAYLYEWPEFVEDVKSRASLGEAVKRKYSPPKESFALYKSSVHHTKQESRFHQAYVILFFALLMVSFFGYRLYSGLYQKLKNEPTDLIVESIDPDLKKAIDDEANKPLINQTPQPAQQPLELKHPYRGYLFTIKATLQNPRFTRTYYELNNGVNSVFLTDEDLKKVGYSINQPNDCSAFLFFNGAEITATCSQANETSDTRQRGGGYNLPKTSANNEEYYETKPYTGTHHGPDAIGLF